MDFFNFFGPNNLHDDNPLTDFAVPPVDRVCTACQMHYAERGDNLCAACVEDVQKVVAEGINKTYRYLANHAAFADWEARKA